MNTFKKIIGVAVFVLILALFASPAPAQTQEAFLKGKVYYLDKENLSLDKKMALALQEFKKNEKGDSYLTGYTFLCSHEIHHGEYDESRPYRIIEKDNKIKVRRISRLKRGETHYSREGTETVGIVFLHDVSDNGKIVDAHMIDLDNTYDFTDIPLYWLGDEENEESFRFLEKEFESGDYSLRKEFVFYIYSHEHPKAHDFLLRAALGNYERKVRESAIFWLGNYKDQKSLDSLKEIFRNVAGTKLKKQVIFALQMDGQPEAVRELIRIAKTEENSTVKKDAIFWLGQKASEESVKALKDVVDEEDEDVKVKESAVFAISRLPKKKSVPMLIDIARTNKSSKVRKSAIFWLGQVDDERALKFFEEILLKK